MDSEGTQLVELAGFPFRVFVSCACPGPSLAQRFGPSVGFVKTPSGADGTFCQVNKPGHYSHPAVARLPPTPL
ncbi:unnamed protein product [Lampetra fluviatilis]